MARAPAEVLKARLQEQLESMKGFTDELTVTLDCKLFHEPSLNSAPLSILAKGQPLFCKNASDVRRKSKKPLSPTSSSSAASAVFKISER